MKKKFIVVFLIIISLIGIVFFINRDNNKKEIKKIVGTKNVDYNKKINDLREKFGNTDIIAYIEIPDVLVEPVVQSTDNDYYLHNDINKKENIIGATFLDYRNKLDDKKLLIYSHSDPEGTLPFVKLNNYNDKEFFNSHKYIYLVISTEKRKYEVFSSYIETEDFDYVNLENFNGLSYSEHLEKLKNKSLVPSDISFDEESKVLILQTCSFEDTGTNKKYQLVISKEE